MVSQLSFSSPLPFPPEKWIPENQKPGISSFLPMSSVCHPISEALHEGYSCWLKAERTRNIMEKDKKQHGRILNYHPTNIRIMYNEYFKWVSESCSVGHNFSTPWTIWSMEFSRLEWVAFPFSGGIFPFQGSNPGLNIHNSAVMNTGGHASFWISFFWMYAQQWDCWIMW